MSSRACVVRYEKVNNGMFNTKTGNEKNAVCDISEISLQTFRAWPFISGVEVRIGLSRFCPEKAKKLLRNMPKSCSKLKKLLKHFVKLLEYF